MSKKEKYIYRDQNRDQRYHSTVLLYKKKNIWPFWQVFNETQIISELLLQDLFWISSQTGYLSQVHLFQLVCLRGTDPS